MHRAGMLDKEFLYISERGFPFLSPHRKGEEKVSKALNYAFCYQSLP